MILSPPSSSRLPPFGWFPGVNLLPGAQGARGRRGAGGYRGGGERGRVGARGAVLGPGAACVAGRWGEGVQEGGRERVCVCVVLTAPHPVLLPSRTPSGAGRVSIPAATYATLFWRKRASLIAGSGVTGRMEVERGISSLPGHRVRRRPASCRPGIRPLESGSGRTGTRPVRGRR